MLGTLSVAHGLLHRKGSCHDGLMLKMKGNTNKSYGDKGVACNKAKSDSDKLEDVSRTKQRRAMHLGLRHTGCFAQLLKYR